MTSELTWEPEAPPTCLCWSVCCCWHLELNNISVRDTQNILVSFAVANTFTVWGSFLRKATTAALVDNLTNEHTLTHRPYLLLWCLNEQQLLDSLFIHCTDVPTSAAASWGVARSSGQLSPVSHYLLYLFNNISHYIKETHKPSD